MISLVRHLCLGGQRDFAVTATGFPAEQLLGLPIT